MQVSAENKLFNDKAASTEARVSMPKTLNMPASKYEYTGGKSADNPVSASGLPKPWPEAMERAIRPNAQCSRTKGSIHSWYVKGDEHHQDVWLSTFWGRLCRHSFRTLDARAGRPRDSRRDAGATLLLALLFLALPS
jgi:hypothetical protein